ncbi:MAG: MBL fold metallo-hydrolase [Erysipelothrix sp.]|nr:MBL fold metallo-hydrolase [Erysipelothrix sp.]
MEINKLTVGPVATNVYIARKDNEVIIVDPGAEFARIDALIKPSDHILGILLTHGHFDHIGAVNELVNKYDIPIFAPEKEERLIVNPKLSFYDGIPIANINYINDGFTLGNFNIKMYETPGHTFGSVTYEIDDVLFTGDTLLNLNVGRQDLPTGSEEDMKKSIEFFKTFTTDYKIRAGHGNDSTLFYQFERNPYFK